MPAVSAQEHMIDGQLLTGAVLDEQVVGALASVDRTLFVPSAQRGSAYRDKAITLGQGRSLIEPLVLARMLAAAELASSDTVLDVACAGGYTAAVLARIVAKVVAVESNERFVSEAKNNLAGLAVGNVTVVAAPITEGYHPAAPYDVIFIEGASGFIPQALQDQLKDGGRLVTLETGSTATERKLGKIVLYRKCGAHLDRSIRFDAAATSLPELQRVQQFVF